MLMKSVNVPGASGYDTYIKMHTLTPKIQYKSCKGITKTHL